MAQIATKLVVTAFLAVSLLGTSSSKAAKSTQPRPEIFTKLLDCRKETDSAARLACYDAQVGAMDVASQRDEVVVLDKTELKKTRRSLFGFAFPKLPFLQDSDKDGDKADAEAARIEAKITSARSLGYGKWSFQLDDDSQWETTEAIANRNPKSGMSIVIKRAAMGSFLGAVNGWPSVRMKRVG